jgi:hypothetical protein
VVLIWANCDTHVEVVCKSLIWGWVKIYYLLISITYMFTIFEWITWNNHPLTSYFRVPRVPGFWLINIWIYHGITLPQHPCHGSTRADHAHLPSKKMVGSPLWWRINMLR